MPQIAGDASNGARPSRPGAEAVLDPGSAGKEESILQTRRGGEKENQADPGIQIQHHPGSLVRHK